MKWFFNVRQSQHSVIVEVRPTEDIDTGYIAAFKHIEFESRKVTPATVKIELSLSAYGDWGIPLDKSSRLIEWLQVAQRLAGHLDNLIETQEDFEKRFEAKQYNFNFWMTSFVEETKPDDNP